MQNNDKKVLLRISNLKQYFPLKGGRFVKANDGITLDIYEGETFGLVGESGCGKSTLGRTILQLYHQTYGRTMYYGRSLDDLAPKYVIDTVKNLKARRTKLRELEQKRDKLEADYAKLSEKEQYAKHGELDTARKLAEDALLDITKIVGGFLVVDDLDPVIAAYSKDYAIARKLSSMEEKRQELLVDVDDAEYAKKAAEEAGKSGKDDQLQKAQEKLKQCDDQIAALRSQLDAGRKEIEALRAPYANDPEFQKYEAYRDDGIDLARLEYNEMRRLRRDMQLIFQDPYSSLNPRMSVGQIISEGMQAHNMIKKKDARMQEMVLKIMDDCGLAPYFLHRFPHQFSGGQRQRIGIARALATKPKFVVCDVSVVKYISDRVGVMYLGTMVELAAADEIFHHPIHPYTEALLNAIPTTDTVGAKELSILEGDIPSPVNPPKGCKFHTRCKYCTEICTQVVPEWEEVRPNHFVACHHKLEAKE